MQVAREFAEEEAFYFPHSLDFRGRAYPMHPHLNHLGNDLCRGLLYFAEARPLGRNGLGWLYVQVSAGAAACLPCLLQQRVLHMHQRCASACVVCTRCGCHAVQTVSTACGAP